MRQRLDSSTVLVLSSIAVEEFPKSNRPIHLFMIILIKILVGTQAILDKICGPQIELQVLIFSAQQHKLLSILGVMEVMPRYTKDLLFKKCTSTYSQDGLAR